MPAGQVILVDSGAGTWLLWDGKRSRIDLADHAITNALGLGLSDPAIPAPRPVASGLFNAIPEAPPLTAPVIPDAGSPANFAVPAPIGAVVTAYSLDTTPSDTYYAVLPDGLQPISPVLAAILRNTNSYGLQQPPRLGADEVARLPVSRMLDTARYPSQPVSLVDMAGNPVICAHWSKPAGAATSSLTLLAGSEPPVTVRTVELVGAGQGAGPAESRWRRAPAISSRASAAAPRHRPPGRCSGFPTPGSVTASTPKRVRWRAISEPQGAAKRLLPLA